MKNNKFRKSFSSRKFKMGSFQTIIMIIVIAVVVVLNIIVARLGFSIDMNTDYLYSLSDDTISFVSGLKDDITIYYLVEDGNETISGNTEEVGGANITNINIKNINIENIINLYDGYGHITVEKRNPVLYPNFAKDYTEEEVADNDVIVVDNNTKKSQYVSFQQDMIESGYDTSSGGYYPVPQYLKLESAVTSAIQKVTLKNTKKVYVTSDHGEQAFGDDFNNLLSMNGMEKEDFEIAKNTEIPEECNLLIMNSPSQDLTDNEYQYISDYLGGGGKAMLFLNYTSETPNFDKLMKDYGINVKSGMVLDPEGYYVSYGSGMYMLLTPNVVEGNSIAADVGNASTMAWYSRGMTADAKVRGSLTTESVLVTSKDAYCKSADALSNNEVDKTDKDESGPFSIAMTALDTHAEDTKGEGHATKLFVVGSAAFTSVPDYSSQSMVSIIGNNQYGNRSILVNALSWLVGDAGDEIQVLDIPGRSLLVDRTTISDGYVRFWTATLLGIVPAALLLVGFLIWNRRRKK